MRTLPNGNRKASIIIICITVVLISACKFYFKTTTDQYTAKENTHSLERGKNLAFAICAGCHYDEKVKHFIGRPLNDLPKIAGHLNSANLTHSAKYGMPDKYSDAELFYLLKTGISRIGYFMPYMMKPMMADADVNDIIMFLRSDDPAVAAYDSTSGQTHINMIGKIGIRHLMGPQPYNKGVERPDENDPVAYGRYLVGVIGCYHCHSRKTTGLNFLDPEKTKGYLEGGIKLKGPKGNRLYGPNLTPDKGTGIGNYTLEEFGKAIREGITPSGKNLSPPMDHFTSLTNKQVNAIYTYLMSIKPVNHEVR
ncbi:MAG: c-type cytochrome [Flavisolibacter sp.]